MPLYVAKPGDYLVKIAAAYETTWQAIWKHPENAEHRRKRGSPDVLYAGDVLYIPETAPTPAPPPKAPPETELPPWAYPHPSDELIIASGPRWGCPAAICTCHDPDDPTVDLQRHVIFLHDDRSQRMAHARSRIYVAGQPAADASADATGAVQCELPPHIHSLFVEWAPADMPAHHSLPYRRQYHVVLGSDLATQVARRLEHIGVTRLGSLEDRIRAFQRAYGLSEDGQLTTAAPILAAYHDNAMLPPLAEPDAGGVPLPPLPPDIRSEHQGAVSAVSDRHGDCIISVKIVDRGGAPIANRPFVLSLPFERDYQSNTSPKGYIDFEYVEADDYQLTLLDTVMSIPASAAGSRRRVLRLIPDPKGR